MLRHEITTSILRFYENEVPGEYEDFIASCVIVWESPKVIWIKGFHGNLQRKHLRKLLEFLVSWQIETIKAFRSPTRLLPMVSSRDGTYVEIKVKDLQDRFMKKV